MKLKNKKTNEIGRMVCTAMPLTTVHTPDGGIYSYRTLAELNEEWEDYEEPKEYWYIDTEGTITCEQDDEAQYDNYRKQIGNYFDTREEAEKAVEKLKAIKRLKDINFKFYGYTALGCGEIHFMLDWEDIDEKQLRQDLDLLFGGEV